MYGVEEFTVSTFCLVYANLYGRIKFANGNAGYLESGIGGETAINTVPLDRVILVDREVGRIVETRVVGIGTQGADSSLDFFCVAASME